MSILASELRIGNWISVNGHPEQVCEISTVAGTEINGMDELIIGQISYIPLTPDILVKAGFEKWREMHFRQFGYLKENIIIEVNEDGTILYIHEPNICLSITSVHQLQNLYFCLTGKELEINL